MKAKESWLFNPIMGNFLSVMVGITIMSTSVYINGHYGVIDNYWPMVAGMFGGSYWIIRLHAYNEAVRIETKGIYINHDKRVLQRGSVMMGASLLIHLLAEGVSWHWLKVSFTGAAWLGGIFWMLFDFMLNLDRGRELFYVSRWYKTARLDRFFSMFNSPVLWLLSKIAIFISTGYLYIKSF